MSKLHVSQIGGYLTSKLKGVIDMADYAAHSDQQQVQKAFLTRALAALAIAHLGEVEFSTLGPNITDGTDDGGIDSVYFDQGDQTLYLVQSKWHEDGHGSIELGDALKFLEGVSKILNDELGGLNARIQARQGDIKSAVLDANAKFVLVVAHTGQEALAKPVEEAFTKFLATINDTSEIMKLRVLSQAELHKAVSAGAAGAPISLEVQLTNWGQVREPYVGFYGQVCATDVANWMGTHGNRLFASNLRQFLGASSVNDDLVATLKNRPRDFWYLNNGITAIVSHIAKKPLGGASTDSGIFECTGFSVVNGAQTVGSISAAYAVSAAEVAKAMVSLRIISTASSPATFGQEVTRCTNTQNAIAKRDFVALDPEQERLRQELHLNGVEYTYKAGTTVASGPSRFDLTEATLALACAFNQVDMAVQAKRELGKLWEDLAKTPYKALFNPGLAGPHMWELVQAHRAIESSLLKEARKHGGRSNLICVHGSRFIEWVAMQALALTPGVTFASVSAKVEPLVRDVVLKVIAAVKAYYGDSYPANLFKNAARCRILVTKL